MNVDIKPVLKSCLLMIAQSTNLNIANGSQIEQQNALSYMYKHLKY